MSSKKLTSILLIASILISTSVQVSAINTQQTVAEESTLATIENNSEETTSVNRWENPTENMTTVEERATEIVLKKDSNKTTQQESQTTIDKVTVKSIVTSTKSLVLENGESRKLTIETDPLDIDKDTLTWQSTNNTIAEADKDGNIIAKGVGSCTIKVYADDGSDVYGYCAVTVTQKVQNFAFKDAPRTMEIGEQITVATNIIPLSATNKILRWTSSDKTVATVSQKGTVTAVGNGKCTITAKTIDGSEVIKSFEVECSGKVAPVEEKIKVTSVSAVAIRKIIKENTSFKMETTVSPSNASNKTLTYTTSNSKVATVDENGNVNAVGKGNCVIYASTKDGSNLRTGCVVTVEENAQSVQFTRKSVVCRVDETVDLKPKSVPDGTTLPDVVYRSTNPNVVTVDKNGVITTLAKGSCQIICISADGMKVYDKSSIVVGQPVSSIKIHGSDTVYLGSSTTLTARIYPFDADNKEVTWNSSDNSIATISRDGTVYGLSEGKVTITCQAKDGSEVFATKQLTVEEEPDAVQQLINVAKEQVGNGPSKYRQWYYDYEGSGIPWCAIFVSWCFDQIDGLGKYIVASAGAGSIARESVASGLSGEWHESEYSDSSTTPQIGDVIEFVWNGNGRYFSQDRYFSDHVGIVYDVDDDYVYTIEGNTGSDDDDKSSVKFKLYDRTSGVINGYYRPDYTK